MTRFSNKLGDEYDVFRLACPHHDEFQECVATTLGNCLGPGVHDQPKVVEVGFGTGITSTEVLSLKGNLTLLGVDNEPLMFSHATENLKGFDPKRFTLRIQDALEFFRGLPNNSADAVVSVWVLHNMWNDYRDSLLGEICRILKPGACFVYGDKIAVTDPAKHAENYAWQIRQLDAFEAIGKPELKREWLEHYEADEHPQVVLKEDKLEQSLVSAGFRSYEMLQRWHMEALVVAQK
jgi:ubiquinone/menaquinone biosynthesis C-methylase UbiE